ncbi:MAG: exodeoxyribonuclease VII large subunit [Saprospiraceae bacterium]
MKTVTLFELNEYIRRILALNLPEALWISCEIAQISEARGHYFLDLVQKSETEETIVAQASAIIWQNNLRQLRRKIGITLNGVLQEGMEVMVKAKVDFNERYGFKLIIEDIDPAYSLGKLALKRRQIVEQLQKENLLHQQKSLSLPLVLQRIAVISSERAAGYQDFLQHLQQNPYGYQFYLHFFQSTMQGDLVESEMLRQLNTIAKAKENFDCVVIIRGGGARLDLNAFDNFNLCKAVTSLKIPVFTGIGHDIDETVLDLVAHASLKTPTAVADFIVHHNLQFEGTLVHIGTELKLKLLHKINNQRLLLNNLTQNIHFGIQKQLAKQYQMLDFIQTSMPRLTNYQLQLAKQNLENLEKITTLLNVEATLQRGFALVAKNGKIIRSKKEIKSGDPLTTRLSDGEFTSKAD